jgi:hypothetical protein
MLTPALAHQLHETADFRIQTIIGQLRRRHEYLRRGAYELADRGAFEAGSRTISIEPSTKYLIG